MNSTRTVPCDKALMPIGKETVREELKYIPAKLQIVRYIRMAYEYPKCKHVDHLYMAARPSIDLRISVIATRNVDISSGCYIS